MWWNALEHVFELLLAAGVFSNPCAKSCPVKDETDFSTLRPIASITSGTVEIVVGLDPFAVEPAGVLFVFSLATRKSIRKVGCCAFGCSWHFDE